MRKPHESGLEGSGLRAMEENEAALKQAQEEMEQLSRRAEAGERVDNEVRKVHERIQRLKKDRGLIEAGGM